MRFLIALVFWASISFGFGWFLAYAFDNPSDYARQGYHQCDSPSGWCDNEKEEKPCGKQ